MPTDAIAREAVAHALGAVMAKNVLPFLAHGRVRTDAKMRFLDGFNTMMNRRIRHALQSVRAWR